MAKARTKGAKRRGRPRIQGLDRTPEGRISRTKVQSIEREKDIKAVVIDMRQRQYGTRASDQPEWGYVLGRIYLDGKLGEIRSGREGKGVAEMRLDAGNEYAKVMARYHALTGIPFPSARAQSLFAVHGYDGEISAERATAARRAADRAMELEGVLLSCSNGRHVASAVKSVCVQDIDESRLWPEHMIELLRTGLDALLFHNGVARARQIR